MSTRTTTPRNRKIAALLALVLAGGMLFAAISQVGSGSNSGSGGGDSAASSPSSPSPASSADAAERQFAAAAKMARRTDGDPMAQGRADAPVVMIEYSDFQCPFCRKFAQDTEQKLIKQYVDKGVLRIEWRNFPIFGKESENAARAAWAAGRQGRFWQFHETAFGNGPEKKNTGAFTPAKLAALAEKAGVENLAKFRTDMASKAAQQALNADSQEGYQLGVSSTPAFLINGRPILGAQPIEQFETAINQARLNAKKQDSMKQDAGKQDAKK